MLASVVPFKSPRHESDQEADGRGEGIPFPTGVLLRAHQVAWQFALDFARPSFLEAARPSKGERIGYCCQSDEVLIRWYHRFPPSVWSLTNHCLSNISAFYDKS